MPSGGESSKSGALLGTKDSTSARALSSTEDSSGGGEFVGSQRYVTDTGFLSGLLIKHLSAMIFLRDIFSDIRANYDKATSPDLISDCLRTPEVVALKAEDIDWIYVARKVERELVAAAAEPPIPLVEQPLRIPPFYPMFLEITRASRVLKITPEKIVEEVLDYARDLDHYEIPECTESTDTEHDITSLHEASGSVEADERKESSSLKSKQAQVLLAETSPPESTFEESSSSSKGKKRGVLPEEALPPDCTPERKESSISKGKQPKVSQAQILLEETPPPEYTPKDKYPLDAAIEAKPLPEFYSPGVDVETYSHGVLSQLLVRHIKTMMRLRITFICAPLSRDEDSGRAKLNAVVESDANKNLQSEAINWDDLAKKLCEETCMEELLLGPLANNPPPRQRPLILLNEINEAAKELKMGRQKVLDELHTYREKRATYVVPASKDDNTTLEERPRGRSPSRDSPTPSAFSTASALSTPGVLSTLLVRHINIMYLMRLAYSPHIAYGEAKERLLQEMINSKDYIALLKEGIDWKTVAARVDYEVHGGDGFTIPHLRGVMPRVGRLLQDEIARVAPTSVYFDGEEEVLRELMYFAMHCEGYGRLEGM